MLIVLYGKKGTHNFFHIIDPDIFTMDLRILILSQWYPPEPALLIQELAKTLQEKGHEVTVLTGFPNYPSGKLYPGYRLRWLQREKQEGIPLVRVALYPDHSLSGIRRALN